MSLEKTQKAKRRASLRNRTEKATSGQVSQNAKRNSARMTRTNVMERETQTRRETKRRQDQENTKRMVRGYSWKKLKELEEMARKPKNHYYHKTYDDNKALTGPALSKHVEVASDSRNDTALTHAHRTQGLGGN